jgi:ADP-ribosylglycohydrolase
MPLRNAYFGSLIADALAMPGHWYYDRKALRRDYGLLDHFQAPRNPHPDSILWRSEYTPQNEKGEILHEQAQYWGQRGIHYHQFLKAGENTLNLQLARHLHRMVNEDDAYDSQKWLQYYRDFMLNPGNHHDTYLEEYHRNFFTRYSAGKPLEKCGGQDEHIGGLAQIPALLAALPVEADWRAICCEHLALTHHHSNLQRACDCFARLLKSLANGHALRDVIPELAGDWLSSKKAEKWSRRPDDEIIGQVFSSACYIGDAFPAALYLAWKYHYDFESGIIANAQVGGDNCHRGVVVGALLGASRAIPGKWLPGLHPPVDIS